MKKKIAALIAAILMLTCACALADDVVTAESLLAGNGLKASLERGDYMREYAEYYDADGEMYDYNDIIYKCGASGYNMLIVYPEDSGASVGATLVGGNYYVTIEDGVPSYTLYASATYAEAGSELEVGEDAYTAYPAFNDGLQMTRNAEGEYVVTAQIAADKCDQTVVADHGHDAAENDVIYDEYTYDADLNLKSEEIYYLRDGDKRLCERITFEYNADGTVYEQYAQSVGTRTITVVLNPGRDDEHRMEFAISDSGSVHFVLGTGGVLYADAAFSAAVPSEGDGASYNQSEYYVVTD